MAGFAPSFAVSHVVGRSVGLALALLVNWLVYALTFDWRYSYVCKCVEDLALFDVPLVREPIQPRVVWRGDSNVTPPRARPSSERAEQALRSTLSAPPPHRVRFVVNTDGRIRECTIYGQVALAVTPSSICGRLQSLRFHPATDRDGTPVAYVLP